jgi:pimeloyl-ACP methyl ester carboxylesterase
MIGAVEHVSIDWEQRPIDIEYQWVGEPADSTPLMVFLHEGLGSLAMWKDFPARLCSALECRGLVYSRPGYGQSTPRAVGEHLNPDFMHRQAQAVLPALLQALGIDTVAQPPWLFGHSDGGSIALLYAAQFPAQVGAIILLSPHIMVEDISVRSIEQARKTYLDTDLKAKLARYHADPDSAFWGWNDIWLRPDFRDWSIEDEISSIRCPVLAVQGIDDEYGTLEQIHGISRRLGQARIVELPECGHSPHRDQPQALLQAARDFMGGVLAAKSAQGFG